MQKIGGQSRTLSKEEGQDVRASVSGSSVSWHGGNCPIRGSSQKAMAITNQNNGDILHRDRTVQGSISSVSHKQAWHPGRGTGRRRGFRLYLCRWLSWRGRCSVSHKGTAEEGLSLWMKRMGKLRATKYSYLPIGRLSGGLPTSIVGNPHSKK